MVRIDLIEAFWNRRGREGTQNKKKDLSANAPSAVIVVGLFLVMT